MLVPAASALTLPPHLVGSPRPEPIPIRLPALEWLELGRVDVSGSVVTVQRGRLLSGPDLTQVVESGGQVKGPGVVRHDAGTAVLSLPRRRRSIPVGVPLTGFGATNWYHWIVELLPKLELLARTTEGFRAAPLVVPTKATRGAALEALRLLAPDADLVAVGRDELVRLERCNWVDSPVLGARTFPSGVRPTTTATAIHAPTLAAYRARLRRAVGLTGDGAGPEGGPPERLLLVRDPSGTAWDPEEVGRRLGLRPVDPGRLGFADQIRLFARAELVVGAWGAAWAGWLFAPRSARGLIWAPDTFRDWPLYANLTQVGGEELQHLLLPALAEDFRPSNRRRPDPTEAQLVAALELASGR